MKAKRSEPQGDTRPELLTDTSGLDREASPQMLSSLIRQPGASPDQPGIPIDEIMAVLEPMAGKAVNFVRSMDANMHKLSAQIVRDMGNPVR